MHQFDIASVPLAQAIYKEWIEETAKNYLLKISYPVSSSDRSKECLTLFWELSPDAGVSTAAGEGVESLGIVDGAGAGAGAGARAGAAAGASSSSSSAAAAAAAGGKGIERLWVLDGARTLVQGVARQSVAADRPHSSIGWCTPFTGLICLGANSPVLTKAQKRAFQGSCWIR